MGKFGRFLSRNGSQQRNERSIDSERGPGEYPEEVDWNEPLSDDEEEYDQPRTWPEPDAAVADGDNDDDDEDDGLAIAIGSRRGRKGSMLEK